jgi:ABC-type multidrug transport system fused ATPase/permease subunit
VLVDVDVAIAPGERVAVVGPTGAGKSTLARLASGLARPDRGAVRYGGVDLRDARPAERRQRFLVFRQESFCVTGTLADNLRLVAPHATDRDLEGAAAALGLDAWVSSHPDGLARDLGVDGGSLSVGERQLVGVLRVALADPAVVVLDEATATLDAATEELVATSLDRVLAQRTVILIAHRPETAARADRTLVVDGGHVHERHVHERHVHRRPAHERPRGEVEQPAR